MNSYCHGFLKEGHMNFWRVPLDSEDNQVSTGIVHILEDRCKGCGYCIEFCPREVLHFSSHFNKKGYHPPSVKSTGGLRELPLL